MKFLSVFLIILSFIASCSKKEATGISPYILPEPFLVPIDDIPDDLETVYFKAWCSGDNTVEEAISILKNLLENDINIRNAWFPHTCSPCMCPSCVACVVLELQQVDNKVLEFDFREETGIWICNCGISEMWQFDFR